MNDLAIYTSVKGAGQMLRIQTVVYLFVRPILNKCGAKSATTQSVYTSNIALQTRVERYVPFPNSRASHTCAVPTEKRNDGSVLCVNGTPIRYKIGDATIRIPYSVNVAQDSEVKGTGRNPLNALY